MSTFTLIIGPCKIILKYIKNNMTRNYIKFKVCQLYYNSVINLVFVKKKKKHKIFVIVSYIA